jgi:F1F0 ATPase subunit 2
MKIMTEMLVLALLAGAGIGTVFFGGLWWTVHKGLRSQNPAAWFLLSFILRMSFAVLGFYWLAKLEHWHYLAIALVGFVGTRMILTRFTNAQPKGVSHAP